MDIHDIREQNYRLLFVVFADKLRLEQGSDRGALDRFGKFADVSPRYLSHVNMGRKRLGDDVCRKIETASRLPHGWMDQLHPEEGTTDEKTAVATFVNLYRAAPLEIQALLMRYMADQAAARRVKPAAPAPVVKKVAKPATKRVVRKRASG